MKENSSNITTSYLRYYFDAERQSEWEQSTLNYKVFCFHKLRHKISQLPEKSFEPTLSAIEGLLDNTLTKLPSSERPETKSEKRALSNKLYQQISQQLTHTVQEKTVGAVQAR